MTVTDGMAAQLSVSIIPTVAAALVSVADGNGASVAVRGAVAPVGRLATAVAATAADNNSSRCRRCLPQIKDSAQETSALDETEEK